LQKTPVISIVDDDEAVRLALRSLVRSLGYVSNVFASAEEFLESSYLNETSCLISVSWLRKSAQDDKWSFCLRAGTLCPANQERP
jgi:FixJ family two-component response regulator